MINDAKGPALALTTKAGFPPLVVSSTTRVPRLNADQLDGYDARDLRSSTYRFRLPPVTGVTRVRLALGGLPLGNYVATYAVVARTSTRGSVIHCGLKTGGPGEAISYGVRRSRTGVATATGSTMIAQRDEHPAQLACLTDTGAFTTDPEPAVAVSSVTLTRLDEVHELTARTVTD